MIYLDNAATTWPKPECVYTETDRVMRYCGGSAGRGSHKLSAAASECLYSMRETAGMLFGCEPENVIFTHNATHALNLAIKSFATDGSHVLISDLEHNSVLRPVTALGKMNVTFDVYGSHFGSAEAVIRDIKSKIRQNTSLVVACHTSNVCGITLPIEKIGALCRKKGIAFVVDASQSSGHRAVDLTSSGADAICTAGHKGLYGPQGTGLLILRGDRQLSPLLEGGTGINSLEREMPELLPERLEAGTQSASLAAGLDAGMKWLMKTGLSVISCRERELAAGLTDELLSMKKVRVFAPSCTGSTVSFNIDGMPPSGVGEKLDRVGICVRCGFHCSPLAHRTLGTGENGSVRVSFGAFNEMREVRFLRDVVYTLTRE
ncbi:MAG: aminotransferase class V-fold PLP-dependent enzyme [Clostridia bacterium]|nr:aminotransferase class V-fold PLP-dependent enzyme [Clostridia bacterium]